jgi:hypothetical protein
MRIIIYLFIILYFLMVTIDALKTKAQVAAYLKLKDGK